MKQFAPNEILPPLQEKQHTHQRLKSFALKGAKFSMPFQSKLFFLKKCYTDLLLAPLTNLDPGRYRGVVTFSMPFQSKLFFLEIFL
ncbi:hypothetical protein BFS30_18450 [Pedobacter steynii]|uniref:Uncharacterized protein n=1 Tax=Pedobacter steynii TaxID=430522 RepID=A0A1D7QJY9_9SPHI|nr:hypothetical protein BFS30_18450 [Pedobacter steynii]